MFFRRLFTNRLSKLYDLTRFQQSELRRPANYIKNFKNLETPTSGKIPSFAFTNYEVQ
jgi:hypothetical protein